MTARDLCVPCRRDLLHRLRPRRTTPGLQQAIERLQQRQIRFGSSQPFGTTSASNRALPFGGKLSEEIFDERGFTETRLARDTQQRSAPGLRCIESRS